MWPAHICNISGSDQCTVDMLTRHDFDTVTCTLWILTLWGQEMQKTQTKSTAPLPTPVRNVALAPAAGPTDETQMADLSPSAKGDTWFVFNSVYTCCYGAWSEMFYMPYLYLIIASNPGIPIAQEAQSACDPDGGAGSVGDTPLPSEPPVPELPPAIPNDSDHDQKPAERTDEPWIVSLIYRTYHINILYVLYYIYETSSKLHIPYYIYMCACILCAIQIGVACGF